MKNIVSKTSEFATKVSTKLSKQVIGSVSVFSKTVSGLKLVITSERSTDYEEKYDEKHYFIIPFELSDSGFALHTMRCLPESTLEINDLPKRRIFHFPNEGYEPLLRDYLFKAAKELAIEGPTSSKSTLKSIADDIDTIDRKLTYGMLLIGGLTAVVNPLIGAGIAAKAVTPGAMGLLNKYGLRPLSEKMNKASVEKTIKQAEDNVLLQFTESTTLRVTNPILQELELALRTSQEEHDPLIDPNLSDGSIPELDTDRWRDLTERAVWHVYSDIYNEPSQHKLAKLGPEDIRWLRTLFARFIQ